MIDLEVGRSWHDSDLGKSGSDSAEADRNGAYHFARIPADVGLFTGAGLKAIGLFGICGLGSGTSTEVSVRFRGRYEVSPQQRSRPPAGLSHQDPDGVQLSPALDGNSNTLVSLTFPSKSRSIDCVLSARRKAE